MSEFHGGFFLLRVDAAIQQPVIDATRQYLVLQRLPVEPYRLTFATERGCPVMHVSVRGDNADDPGAYVWHTQHAELGGSLARAIGQPVWAYCYENRSGYEAGVALLQGWHWGTRQRRRSRPAARAPGARGLRRGRGMPRVQAPPGQARRAAQRPSGPAREGARVCPGPLLVPLEGTADPEALARYLAGPLKDMRERPNPQGSATRDLLLSSSVAEELLHLAAQLEPPREPSSGPRGRRARPRFIARPARWTGWALARAPCACPRCGPPRR